MNINFFFLVPIPNFHFLLIEFKRNNNIMFSSIVRFILLLKITTRKRKIKQTDEKWLAFRFIYFEKQVGG